MMSPELGYCRSLSVFVTSHQGIVTYQSGDAYSLALGRGWTAATLNVRKAMPKIRVSSFMIVVGASDDCVCGLNGPVGGE
jgi:hypothetical protein